jgi:hypothetical protein
MRNELLFDCGILYRIWRLWQSMGLAFECLVSWSFRCNVATHVCSKLAYICVSKNIVQYQSFMSTCTLFVD